MVFKKVDFNDVINVLICDCMVYFIGKGLIEDFMGVVGFRVLNHLDCIPNVHQGNDSVNGISSMIKDIEMIRKSDFLYCCVFVLVFCVLNYVLQDINDQVIGVKIRDIESYTKDGIKDVEVKQDYYEGIVKVNDIVRDKDVSKEGQVDLYGVIIDSCLQDYVKVSFFVTNSFVFFLH